jgi:hypothetical protein
LFAPDPGEAEDELVFHVTSFSDTPGGMSGAVTESNDSNNKVDTWPSAGALYINNMASSKSRFIASPLLFNLTGARDSCSQHVKRKPPNESEQGWHKKTLGALCAPRVHHHNHPIPPKTG